MFRGTICCSGFAWDRSITLPVASQELSQNSFCCCPNKKGFWSVASVGKLSLKLRVNKSSDRGIVVELLHLSIPSSAPSQCCTHTVSKLPWAATAIIPLLPWSKLQCPKDSFQVFITVGVCSCHEQQAWVTASEWLRKTYSTVWRQEVQAGVWGSVRKGFMSRQEALQSIQHLGGGCRVWSKGVGSCGIALSEPDVLHSWLWQPQWRVQGRCSGHRWTWWMEAVFALEDKVWIEMLKGEEGRWRLWNLVMSACLHTESTAGQELVYP